VLNDIVNAATPSTPAVYTRLVDISGYDLDLTGISKTEVNTLVTRAVAIVDTNAVSSVNLTAGERITFNNKLIDIVPYFVRGYFGNQFYNYNDATAISAFDMIASGTLDIESVDVDIEFRNGIGVDAQMVINQFGTVNSNNATSANLSHSIIGSPININRSVLTGSNPEVTYTNYLIDVNTGNSNIDQLIELFPNQLVYDIDLTINPLGNVSGNNDFVYKKHVLEANLNVEFPLSLIATNLTLRDTVNFSLTEQTETGRINNGTLFIYADNGFPFDATIQMDLYDEAGNFLQALDVNSYIQAAPVDASFRVTNKRQSVLAVPLNATSIDNLYKASNIILQIGFSTVPQSQFIKIYEEYAIDLQIVGDFSYNFSVD